MQRNMANCLKGISEETKTSKGCKLITRKKCYCVKQEELRFSLNAEQADWKDDTDDESDDQELEAHYMYMAQLQEVTPDQVDNSGPIFDDEPMHKELCTHQETISIMSQAKEAQIKFYKTRKDEELDKVIALENKVKFCKPEFLMKAQERILVLYDNRLYNENLAFNVSPDLLTN
ncbi:hypothetical protein Tco_1419319 [Tanacetum coccineum]